MARKKLPKGWTEGSIRDLLDLSDDEAAIVEMRVRLAEKVREERRARRITQKERFGKPWRQLVAKCVVAPRSGAQDLDEGVCPRGTRSGVWRLGRGRAYSLLPVVEQ